MRMEETVRLGEILDFPPTQPGVSTIPSRKRHESGGKINALHREQIKPFSQNGHYPFMVCFTFQLWRFFRTRLLGWLVPGVETP
jgi:hypothetical protein